MVEAIIIHNTPDAVRETTLSIDTLIFRMLLSLVEPGVGMVEDRWGFSTACLLLGCFSMVAIFVILKMWCGVYTGIQIKRIENNWCEEQEESIIKHP